jgi:type IV pilus assembly protein PilA
MKSTLNNTRQKGFSLIELLIVVVILGVLAAIAIPNLLVSRRAANESSAISSVRTLGSAEATFFSTDGQNQVYANGDELFQARLIDDVLYDAANGGTPKSGYRFSIATTGTPGPGAGFLVTSLPTSPTGLTATGSRNFCIMVNGVIKAVPAPAADFDETTCADAPPLQ